MNFTPNWSESYLSYLKSPAWFAIRKNLFKSRGKKCERCGSGKRIEVHHLTYIRLGNERMSDLEVLCNVCHASEHEKKPKKIKKPKNKPVLVKAKRSASKHAIQRLSDTQLRNQGYSETAIKEYQKWWTDRLAKQKPITKIKTKVRKPNKAYIQQRKMDTEVLRRIAYSN